VLGHPGLVPGGMPPSQFVAPMLPPGAAPGAPMGSIVIGQPPPGIGQRPISRGSGRAVAAAPVVPASGPGAAAADSSALQLPARSRVRCVRWAPCGTRIAVGLETGSILLFSAASAPAPPAGSSAYNVCPSFAGAGRVEFRAHGKAVVDAEWEPRAPTDSRSSARVAARPPRATPATTRLVAVSHDKQLSGWSARGSSPPVEVFRTTFPSGCEAVAWASGSDARFVLASTRDDFVHVVDVGECWNSAAQGSSVEAKVLTKSRMKEEVISLEASPDGVHVLAALGNGQIVFLRAPDATAVTFVRACTNRLLTVAVDGGRRHPDATPGAENAGAGATEIETDGDAVMGGASASLQPAVVPKRFAAGGHDSVVTLWDAGELACIASYAGMTWPVNSLAMNVDSTLCAAGGEDSYIGIFSAASGRPLHNEAFEGRCADVRFHPTDPRTLAIASDNRGEGALYLFRY
jgi:WD40 repeat protein